MRRRRLYRASAPLWRLYRLSRRLRRRELRARGWVAVCYIFPNPRRLPSPNLPSPPSRVIFFSLTSPIPLHIYLKASNLQPANRKKWLSLSPSPPKSWRLNVSPYLEKDRLDHFAPFWVLLISAWNNPVRCSLKWSTLSFTPYQRDKLFLNMYYRSPSRCHGCGFHLHIFSHQI